MRLDGLPLPECEFLEVQSRAEQREHLQEQSAGADYTLVIAPEFDGILFDTHVLVSEANGTLLGCADEFVALTTDKHRTAERLAAAGVPVPEAILLEADEEKLPVEFQYPAVLKPVDGAGSQHTLLVSKASDEPPPYAWPRRLERFCPGVAASVAFLCGPTGRLPLPACRQSLSEDGHFSYLGGASLANVELAARATKLGEQALDALPEAKGYVGVDLILGHAADGSEDGRDRSESTADHLLCGPP